MTAGIVKFFKADKGYGFIESENEGDVFVHISALQRSGIKGKLAQGMRVNFEIETNPRNRKKQAVNLRLTSTQQKGPFSHMTP